MRTILQFLLILSVFGLWSCASSAPSPTATTAATTGPATPQPMDEAQAAWQTWLTALQQGRCEEVEQGLARQSPFWAAREGLLQACRQGGEALAPWQGLRVARGEQISAERVVLHLESPQGPRFAVMYAEDGQWKYGGDVFAEWQPQPALCAHDGVAALWGPVWDRAAAVTVGLTLTNQGQQPLRWQAPCARLEWADGSAIPAEACPETVTLAPGETWRGELVFPKPAAAQGRPWTARPQRIVLENLQAGDDAPGRLLCTWHEGP